MDKNNLCVNGLFSTHPEKVHSQVPEIVKESNSNNNWQFYIAKFLHS